VRNGGISPEGYESIALVGVISGSFLSPTIKKPVRENKNKKGSVFGIWFLTTCRCRTSIVLFLGRLLSLNCVAAKILSEYLSSFVVYYGE
jgi:hypothetical protein